jgi:hypothetical protein
MGLEWDFGRLAGGGGVDSLGSGYGPVAGCCECGDEPSGSGATELFRFKLAQSVCLRTQLCNIVTITNSLKEFFVIKEISQKAYPDAGLMKKILARPLLISYCYLYY